MNTRTSETPVALVTGASSGLGRATATLLSARGYRVFSTSRAPSRALAAEYLRAVVAPLGLWDAPAHGGDA